MTFLSLFTGIVTGSWLLTGCGKSARNGYRVEDGKVVLYSGFPASVRLLEGADAESFVAITDHFGKDKNHAYFYERIIPDADPATFTFLASSYSRDKNRGYSCEKLISNDGAHFNIVPNPNETATSVSAEGIPYARDRRQVYKDTNVIEGADPATFTMVPMFNGIYLTYDHRRVYFHDQPLEGADGATFQKVSEFHFTTQQGAWGLALGRETHWERMPDVDLATFTGLGKNHARDKNHVYSGNSVLKKADPNTFQETGNPSVDRSEDTNKTL
ncbi:DKNYY domain-containing protein [Larkinella rosea]|nr:DKNYY domain-containing protein [Larkinella rosea]